MKPLEEQDEQEYIIVVKQSVKFQLCALMAYFAIIKKDEEKEEETVAEFLQEAIQLIVTSLRDEDHDSELSLDFTGISLVYHSCLAGIYMLDCSMGKDFLRHMLRLDAPKGHQEDLKVHMDEFKSVAHYYINDIDERYGHVPEMALLRKDAEARWSWLRKN